jgi:hypothetical protein
MNGPDRLDRRTVGEWTIPCRRKYANPFTDVRVDVTFLAPSGQEWRVPAFYDDQTPGGALQPGEAGAWRLRSQASP